MEYSKEDIWFIEWEQDVFGYGYGTGEMPILKALRVFLNDINNGYSYDIIENDLGKSTAWLLINIAAQVNIIEYGTSPRNSWLTSSGKLLLKYIRDKTTDDLYKILMCNYNEVFKKMDGIDKNPFRSESIAYKILNK